MIHYRKEGAYYKLGLNITVGLNEYWPWIAFAWIWYNVEKRELFKWYLRLRTWRLAYIYSCYSHNVVNTYLISHNAYLVPEEFKEDLDAFRKRSKAFDKLMENHKFTGYTK